MNWFKAVCTDLMSRLFKTNTIGLEIAKQIFHIGDRIIPKLIKNVFKVVLKKLQMEFHISCLFLKP